MDALVVYCSQTGSAKTYAAWLAEDLACPVAPLEELDARGTDCDLVVFCSWFHAASLVGVKRFQAYMAAHPQKRYAVVAVGATPMPGPDYPASEHEEAFRRSFPAERYPDLPWCYCQGNFHFEQLSLADRLMMRAYFAMLRKSAREGNRRDGVALESMRAGFDGCRRAYLEPLHETLGTGSFVSFQIK